MNDDKNCQYTLCYDNNCQDTQCVHMQLAMKSSHMQSEKPAVAQSTYKKFSQVSLCDDKKCQSTKSVCDDKNCQSTKSAHMWKLAMPQSS